jgi:diacylglycerol kinase family enzyme
MASYYQRRALRARASIAFITVQRITVLLNRRAGTHDDAVAERVSDAFRSAGAGEPEIRIIEGAWSARLPARRCVRGSTIVVAGGGDGTVSSVASAIVGKRRGARILPLGTLNHFAKDAGCRSNSTRRSARLRRTTVRVDVGDVNGRPFINNASVGMYASLIAERLAMQRLGRRKWLAHGLAAARVWRRYHRLHVLLRADGRKCTCQHRLCSSGTTNTS